MKKYLINGGNALNGEVEISGAKNAAVAIIPAALLVSGRCRIENIPDISDVDKLIKILECFGAKVSFLNKGIIEIDCSNVEYQEPPRELMSKIRASYYFVGAMLGRFGATRATMPGGCVLGQRPIDQHLKGMRGLGAEIDVEGDCIVGKAIDGRLHGSKIYLDKVSVGATMNIILAASVSQGRTVIENAAKEPHIVDLANFLNSMGADIRGAGTDTIKVFGKEKLSGGSYAIIPDMIEAGTYMIAAAACGGEVRVKNVIPKHLESVTAKLREMKVPVIEGDESVLVKGTGRIAAVDIKTMPYPGFPTDMQPQTAVALCLANGTSTIIESIYDNRFKYMAELQKMGAKIKVEGRTATIFGPNVLKSAQLTSYDLRAGAAMVIAALCAKGQSEVSDIEYIERGYENLVPKLRALGADIIVVDDNSDLS